MLHASFNTVVMLSSAQDVMATIASPLCSLAHPMLSWKPAYFVISGHLYHALAFDMKANEARHHFIFSGIGGVVTLALPWGSLMSLCLFMISGLPGALDYAMLSAVKVGRFPRLKEKKINNYINTYVRIPGLVAVSVIAAACLAHGSSERLPTPILVFAMVLSYGNGVFYGEQVIGSYHKELALARLASMNAKPACDALHGTAG